MPKVSIIIPVYNVEKYLRECLDSVVNQTLKDIEIICVNDGSTDNSLEILKEYAQKDFRIKIISKPNSGYGASMNVGVDNAIGDYIGIVESDDFVEKDMFEKLYNVAIENDCDLVRCQYSEYKTKTGADFPVDSTWVPQNTVYCPLTENLTPFKQAPAIWTNLVKKELLKEHNIRFLETPGASYQDTSFAFKLYACAKRFIMIPDVLLHYRTDNENSSINSVEKANFVITEYEEIVRFAKEHNVYDRLSKLIPKIKFACYRWNYNRLNASLKFPFLLKMSKEYRQDLKNGNIDRTEFTKKEICNLKVIAYFPFLYRFRRKI